MKINIDQTPSSPQSIHAFVSTFRHIENPNSQKTEFGLNFSPILIEKKIEKKKKKILNKYTKIKNLPNYG